MVHGIDQHILIYCVEGSGSAEIARKKYEIEPGSFIIIPAGDRHWYSASEENSWTIYWVHFNGAAHIKKISDLPGIEDPFYFSRMFNKLMGVSPNQYRVRKHLQEIKIGLSLRGLPSGMTMRLSMFI